MNEISKKSSAAEALKRALAAKKTAQQDGGFVGMSSFGASGPGDELFAHFGITAEAVVQAVKGVIA